MARETASVMPASSETPLSLPPQRHLAVGTLLATAAQVAPFAASAAMSLAIARLYGPSGTGVISLVMSLFDVVVQVFTIGLSTGITYLVSRGEWPLRQASQETRRAALLLGGAGTACGLIFYVLTRHTVLKGVTPVLAIVSLASLPFALSWAFRAATALGRNRYEAYTGLQVIYSLVMVVAGVTLAVLFGLTGAVIGFSAANVVTAGFGAMWMRRASVREHVPARPGQFRRAARFGLQAWSANLMQYLNYRVDLFILSAVAARGDVGLYSVAVSVTALGWVLPNAFQTVLFPRVAGVDAAVGTGSVTSEASDASAARAIRHSVLLVIPTLLGLAILVLLVPLLYGPRFQGSVALGFILAPGVAALGLGKVISAVFSGRGFPRYSLYTTLITAPITLALYVALIPTLHATGAALASTLSYVLTTILSGVFLRRATAIPLRTALIPTRSDLVDYLDAFRFAHGRVRRGRSRRA